MRISPRFLFRRVANEQFLRLFIKNTLVVLLSILLPLLFAVLAVYSYSYRSLLQQTDTANARSLENTRTTVDMIFRETDTRLLTFASNSDIKDFIRASKEVHPDFPYFKRANEIMKNMQTSRRLYLDSAITIFSELGNFTLSTQLGGQSFPYYDDKEMLKTYQALKDANPSKDVFYVLRNFSYSSSVLVPKWTLVAYRTIPVIGSPKYSFVSINILADQLTEHLTSNTDSENGTILLVNENGQIMLDSTGARMSTQISSVFREGEMLNQFLENKSGAATIDIGEGIMQRVSWIPSQYNNWRCVQMIPFQDYSAGMRKLQSTLVLTVLIGLAASLVIAYVVSLRLFIPVMSILEITENPNSYNETSDKSGEIQYLLMNVLHSFQKNMLLESEMVDKMAALRNARAKALQEQMTPHFLYNALQAINWLAIAETGLDDSRTSHTIVTLSEIVRTCMEQSDNFSTVGEEIDYVKKYMEIAQLRFGEGVSCQYHIDPWAEDMQILRISLQPLVENAISHGIQPHSCRGTIYIRIGGKGELLHIAVEDDGIGMTEEQMAQTVESCQTEYVYANQHVGLVNLSQRLKLVYGDGYQVRLSKSYYGGLCVEFDLPKVKIVRPSADETKL